MPDSNPEFIYKIVDASLWGRALETDHVPPMEIDRTDGYLHLSTRSQLDQTLRLYFAGQPETMILAVRTEAVSDLLKWEPSRGGALFPHIYGTLPRSAVAWVEQIDIATDGTYTKPDRLK